MDFKFKARDIISEGRTTTEHVEAIKSWLSKVTEDSIPKKLPEEMIVLFLLSCSNDISLTKHTIISYYKLRKASSLIFDSRRVDCPDIELAFRTFSVSMVSKPKEREVVIFFKLRETNYKNAKMQYALKLICMLLDVCQEDDPPDTISIVIDMKGFTIMHMTMLHLEALRTAFSYVQEACPIRLNTIHCVNSNFVLQRILAICKIFMKQGLIERMHCHKGVQGLSDFIPIDDLPKDYGGNRPPTEELRKKIFKRFTDKQKFWEEEENMRKQYY